MRTVVTTGFRLLAVVTCVLLGGEVLAQPALVAPPNNFVPFPKVTVTGSGTEADPYVTEIEYLEGRKDVRVQYSSVRVSDRRDNSGVGAYEEWVAECDLFTFYLLVNGNWIEVGYDGSIVDSCTSTAYDLDANGNLVQIHSRWERRTRQAVVDHPAEFFPVIIPATFKWIGGTIDQGMTWNTMSFKTSQWDVTWVYPWVIRQGWRERYREVLEGIEVSRTLYWIEWGNDEPVPRQDDTVFVRQ